MMNLVAPLRRFHVLTGVCLPESQPVLPVISYDSAEGCFHIPETAFINNQ